MATALAGAGFGAISGTLSMLLPTSVALVIFGLLAEVNIGQLLISGIMPAILVTATIMLTIQVLVWLGAVPRARRAQRALGATLRLLRRVSPMLLLFSVVTGTIYLGVPTPTDSSAFGAFGALILAALRGRVTAASLRRTRSWTRSPSSC